MIKIFITIVLLTITITANEFNAAKQFHNTEHVYKNIYIKYNNSGSIGSGSKKYEYSIVDDGELIYIFNSKIDKYKNKYKEVNCIKYRNTYFNCKIIKSYEEQKREKKLKSLLIKKHK